MVSSEYARVCQRAWEGMHRLCRQCINYRSHIPHHNKYKSTPIHTIHRVTYLCQMMVITILEKARPVSDSVAEVDTCVVCGVQCESSNMSTKHGGGRM